MKLELTAKEVKSVGGKRAIEAFDKKVTPWAWLVLILAIIGATMLLVNFSSFEPDSYTTPDGQVIETHTADDYILIDDLRVEADQTERWNIPLAVIGGICVAIGFILVIGLAIYELFKAHEEGYKFLDLVIKGEAEKEQ